MTAPRKQWSHANTGRCASWATIRRPRHVPGKPDWFQRRCNLPVRHEGPHANVTHTWTDEEQR